VNVLAMQDGLAAFVNIPLVKMSVTIMVNVSKVFVNAILVIMVEIVPSVM